MFPVFKTFIIDIGNQDYIIEIRESIRIKSSVLETFTINHVFLKHHDLHRFKQINQYSLKLDQLTFCLAAQYLIGNACFKCFPLYRTLTAFNKYLIGNIS